MRITFFFLFLFTTLLAPAQDVTNLFVGDTVKATTGFGQFKLLHYGTMKGTAGLSSGPVSVRVDGGKKGRRQFRFRFPSAYAVVATGEQVKRKGNGELRWASRFVDSADTVGPYRFLIASATDSAENFALFSGYVYLPDAQRWKFLGTVRRAGWGYLPDLSIITSGAPENGRFEQVAVQRSNGSYKTLSGFGGNPSVTPLRDLDSLRRAASEKGRILEYTQADSVRWQEKSGVFYRILQPGTGRQVAVTDTLEVYYKGYLFPNGPVFDQTKEKTARFPLNRLIPGWQIALPELKEGGKMIGIIPSGLAYSIRTRSPKIPPNSILVFEVEVVKATPGR